MDKLIEIWNGRFGLIVTILSLLGMIGFGVERHFDHRYFKKDVRREMVQDSLFRQEVREYMKANEGAWVKQVGWNGKVDMYIKMDME